MRYVYCHPLFDERKCAHRFSFQLKNAFQAAGLNLERFDYRGTGEAEGEFADVSLESLREDVATFVRGQQSCLIGLRFGATLAFDYSTRSLGPVTKLILLQPIVDGAEYVDHLYRKQHIKNILSGKLSNKLSDEGYDNLEGYKTNIKFIKQIQNLSLLNSAEECCLHNPVFIVQISNGSSIDPEIAGFAKALESTARKVVTENVKLPIFWERIPAADYSELTQKISQWCHV